METDVLPKVYITSHRPLGMQFGVKTPKMITLGLALLAVIQVTLGHCADNEHVVNALEVHNQHLNCPNSPAPHPEVPANCGCPCQPTPCPCQNIPCPGVCPNELLDYPLPCIQSLTKLGSNPWVSPYGPVLQSVIGNPLCCGCCDPLVPVVQKHEGHHVVKFVKHVPVVRKYCRPELVIRTRNVPVVRHRKRIFLEPITVHIPVTDKLIRQVVHQYVVKVPVVHKCLKPFKYHTVHHVPASVAKCLPPCSPCAENHHMCPQCPHPYPLGPFPPTACEAPCPQACDCCSPCGHCAQPIPTPCSLPCPPVDESPCCSPCPCKP